jgi:hypothetical protein
MDLSTIEALGWRDAVIAAVAIIGIYILVSIVRYFRLRQRRQDPVVLTPAEPVMATPTPPAAAQAIAPPPREPWPHTEADFADHLRASTTVTEMKHLRGDLARMRDELTSLGDELVGLRQELELLKASRNVSPLYGEAIGLAQQGMDARSIADRCDISIGEAELVAALSRKQETLPKNSEEDHERK